MKRLLPTSLFLLAGLAHAQEPPPPVPPVEAPPAPSPPPEAPPEAPPEVPPAEPVPPAEVPVPAASATDPEIEALRAEMRAMKATLDAQRDELARQKLLLIPDRDLEFELDGYYRVRGHVFNHLLASQGTGDDYQDGRYMQMRLRMQPQIRYRQLAKFFFQVDALDDVVVGDNQSLASTALFAGDPSTTNLEGDPIDSIQVSRAWMEVTVPVGLIRAGRMTSHWGMGLLANGGDGFDDTFGENHYGATYDRFLFATRPIAVAQAIAGKDDSDIPLFFAVGVDRLVEDPLIQYYGYQCDPGIPEADEDYDRRCDADADGVTDLDHGFTNEDRDSDDRRQDWWADQDDDVMEMVYVLIYRGEDVKFLGAKGDLTAGTYVVNRVQRETDSNVLIADAYVNIKNRGVRLEFEGLTIQGQTRAITLPGAFDPTGAVDDPLYKQANIWGYVGRLGYEQPGWAAFFETGYASGDNNVADADFSGRPLHPDHNVGLLLYEEVIARVTAQGWGEGARGLWSQGGVYNSRYIFPNVRVYPLDNWELIGAFLMAWPDRPDGAFIRCNEDVDEDCATYPATAGPLGTEIDIALKHRWHEHVLFSMEAGFAHATDRLPLEAAGLNPEGNFFTFQSRLAYEF